MSATPSTTANDELSTKELDIGFRTIQRWTKLYLEQGEVGLISIKAVQPELGSKTFELFEHAALDIMIEHTEAVEAVPELRHRPRAGAPDRDLRRGRGPLTLPGHCVSNPRQA